MAEPSAVVPESSGETGASVQRRTPTGRPFQPGTSGNPGGRPRIAEELRALCQAQAPAMVVELVRLATKAKSESARVAAIKELLNRGYGLPRDDDGKRFDGVIEVRFVKKDAIDPRNVIDTVASER